MEYEPVDTDVTNTIEDSGVVESTLVEADEDVTIILGEHVNGNPVTVDVRYFAVLEVERELDEEEQAMYPDVSDGLHFSSVLVAAENGEASQETVINVQDATVEEAIDGLSQVTEEDNLDDSEGESSTRTESVGQTPKINVMRTSQITYEYEDGQLIDPTDVETEEA